MTATTSRVRHTHFIQSRHALLALSLAEDIRDLLRDPLGPRGRSESFLRSEMRIYAKRAVKCARAEATRQLSAA